MKSLIIYCFLLALLTGISCQRSRLTGIPSCIENRIDAIRSKPVTNPPAQVWRWKVDGQIYYYFTSPCCDQFNYLYDEDCNQVCSPDGGFTGSGDGKCPEFSGEVEKTLIWEDKR